MSGQSALDQLLSEAGINLRVTRWEFRSSLEKGCSICVPLYGNSGPRGLQGWVEDSRTGSFRFFDDEDPSDDDQGLTFKYWAEVRAKGGPYDIHRLKVAALQGKRSLLCDLNYHVYASHGNMLLFGLLV